MNKLLPAEFHPYPYPHVRLWIAEDDDEFLETLGNFLGDKGREIRLFNNGQKVLEALKSGESFEIIITDLVMPGSDGLSILKEVKAYHPESMVIIMTGYASLDTAIQAIRGGAYDYIRKPFKLDELGIIVNNACEKVSLLRENRCLLQKLNESMEELEELRRNWEEHRVMILGMDVRSMNKKISELDLVFNQIPPGYDSKRIDFRDKALNHLERLIQLKKEGLIDHNEFLSFKKILLQKIDGLY